MVLSAYELEREANIQRNRAVLASLGLGDGIGRKPSSHIAPKPAPPPKRVDDVSSEPSRRSNRVSKKTPLFTGLTDAFFKSEENDAEVRELPAAANRSRRPSNQTKRFEVEFGYDVKPRKKLARASVEEAPATMDCTMPMDWTMPLIPPISRTAAPVENTFAPASEKVEKKARSWFFMCHLCKQQWSLRCDGRTLQKHDPCVSVVIFQ